MISKQYQRQAAKDDYSNKYQSNTYNLIEKIAEQDSMHSKHSITQTLEDMKECLVLIESLNYIQRNLMSSGIE